MLRAVSLVALSLLVALVAACGGGGGSGGTDPATAVPRDAAVYVEATIRPEGDLRSDALDAAARVLRTDDPERRIRSLLDRAFEGDGLSYSRDVEPWLGDRAGLWASARLDANGEPGVVVVVPVRDADAARDAVSDAGGARRSYEGVEYVLEDGGPAFGVIDDEVLAVGDEAEFKRTVDALRGDSLAEQDEYGAGLDRLDDNRLAHFFVDLPRLVRLGLAGSPDREEQLRQLESLVPLDRLGPLVGSFKADGDRLALDMRVDASGGSGPLGALGDLAARGSTPLMADLPGDSWAAFGAPRYGDTLRRLLDAYAGPMGGAVLEEQLRQRFGLDLEQDVLSWVGDVAFFVRGTSPSRVDGGAVIEVTDDSRAADGFGKLVGALQAAAGIRMRPVEVAGASTALAAREWGDGTLPRPVVFARRPGKVVVAYGAQAAAAAFASDDRLGDAEVFGRAKDVLGRDPSLLLSVPAVVSLIDASGEADADWRAVRPYLEAYDVLAAGAEVGGSHVEATVAAGLR